MIYFAFIYETLTGRYMGECPDFNEVFSSGDTSAACQKNLGDVFDIAILEYKKYNWELPEPKSYNEVMEYALDFIRNDTGAKQKAPMIVSFEVNNYA